MAVGRISNPSRTECNSVLRQAGSLPHLRSLAVLDSQFDFPRGQCGFDHELFRADLAVIVLHFALQLDLGHVARVELRDLSR